MLKRLFLTRWRLFYIGLGLVLFSLMLLVYLAMGQAWSSEILIGGRFDSPWLGSGFYTKALASDTQEPFRWTSEKATLQFPSTGTSYVIDVRASKGSTDDQKSLTLYDEHIALLELPLEKGFRIYSVYWQPQHIPSNFMTHSNEALLLSTPVSFFPGDSRAYGAAINRVRIARNQSDFGWYSMVWVIACVVGLWVLYHPITKINFGLFAITSLAAILSCLFLSWLPISRSVWLPIVDLPSWLTLAIWAGVFVRWKGQYWWAGVLLVLAGITYLLYGMAQLWTVEGPDFTWHINHGSSLASVFNAHPFYPLGFPLLLWIGSNVIGDALAFGQFLAGSSTVIVFGLVALIARRVMAPKAAILACLVLLGSPWILGFGIVASSDGVQLLPLFGGFVVLSWNSHLTAKRICWAGLLFGIAYLFRHQALMVLILVLPWLLFNRPELPVSWQNKRWLRNIPWALAPILLIFGFLLGSAPQWILDIRDTGRPFYSKQYENIWTFGYSRTDAPVSVDAGIEGLTNPNSTGLYDIVAFDPYQLLRHWSQNLSYFGQVILHNLWIWPLGLLALVSILGIMFQQPDPRLILWAFIPILYVGIVTLTANKERFFLPILPLLALTITWLIMQLNQQVWQFGRLRVNLGLVVQALLFVWVLRHLGALQDVLAVYGFPRS